jgi:sulfate-transporting ATPase
MFTVIGGTGFVVGAALGSILAPGGVGFWIGHQLIDDTTSWLALLAGVLLLLTLVIHPDGQAELASRKLERFRRRRQTAVPAPVPTESVDELPPAPTQVPLPLTVEGVSVSFGGVRVLDDVSLTVEPGRIVGLIGANGAGKTTLLEAISGYVHPAAGTVRVGDATVTGASAVRLARTGMRRSFQGVESFDDLSVSENLLVAHERLRARSWLRELVRPTPPVLPTSLATLAADFDLTQDLEKSPNELPFGRRRLLGVARALAGHPTILLLDEPASGLSTDETQELADLIRTVVGTYGIGVLLVEHDVDMVLGLCDEVVVLDVGRVIFRGAPTDVLADPGVRAAYLGESEPVVTDAVPTDAVPTDRGTSTSSNV